MVEFELLIKKTNWIVKIHQIGSIIPLKEQFNCFFVCLLSLLNNNNVRLLYFFPLPFSCSEILSNLILFHP